MNTIYLIVNSERPDCDKHNFVRIIAAYKNKIDAECFLYDHKTDNKFYKIFEYEVN